jgi:hypothetical protein
MAKLTFPGSSWPYFLLQAGLDALQGAESGERRGVAAAPVHPVHAYDAVGLLVDVVHVIDRGADVLGRDVAAAERADEAAERAEQALGLVGLGVADEHRLAASEVEPRHRRLVGHAARQPEHVLERFLIGRIGPHPQAAQRGAECRVVNGHDGSQAAVLVLEKDDLLVAHALELLEEIHQRRPPALVRFWASARIVILVHDARRARPGRAR